MGWQLHIDARLDGSNPKRRAYYHVTVVAMRGGFATSLAGIVAFNDEGASFVRSIRRDEFLLDTDDAERMLLEGYRYLRGCFLGDLDDGGDVEVRLDPWFTGTFGQQDGLRLATLVKTAALTFGPDCVRNQREENDHAE